MKLFHGDCIDVMKTFPDASIDLIFADLPYATTYASWDCLIPFPALWEAYGRLIKPKGAILLTASQPFTSALVMSKPEWFRCEWVWDKVNGANFANANRQPLKTHESVLVFGPTGTNYYPIKVPGKPNHVQGKNAKARVSETQLISERIADDKSGLKFPKSIQTFAKHSSQCGLHPTQKPVDMLEYFIKSYSLEGDTVLDNTMGSGSTGAACLASGREFVGIEKEQKYFDIAKERLNVDRAPAATRGWSKS